MAHVYFGAEVLSMTTPQRDTLVAALKALIHARDGMPARRNHWRIRTDGNAGIWEAHWSDNDWTIATVKVWLGNVFAVDPSTITHSVSSTAYGPLVTFIRGGQNRLRLIRFGGASPTWEQSRQAAVLYLKDNAAAWEEV